MTSAQQQTYYRQHLRFHRQQERAAVRVVLARFIQLQAGLVTLMLRSSPSVLLATLDLHITEDFHLSMLQAIYQATGVAAAEREHERLVPSPVKTAEEVVLVKDRDTSSPDPTPADRPEPNGPRPSTFLEISHLADRWRNRINQMTRSSDTAKRVKGMTAKTVSLVRDVLNRGIGEQSKVSEIVSKMRDVVVDKARALLIGRTETTRAANVGAEAGADSTGLKLIKRWIALQDGRTRPDHLAMLRKPAIPSDDLFSVGNTKMKYPGDPAGGAKQVCGCRCIVRYDLAPVLFNN